ncbi:MAG TPA: hypothetical protein VFW07_21820 [Parafilimonas sp.]|nr:hypothetical protein [Parafilimonas sp.]
MNKLSLLIAVFCMSVVVCAAQMANGKMLYIIDSVPLYNDPEEWNKITDADIADCTAITNSDSLRLLGWGDMSGVTYVFTRAYRNRPDSIKSVPSLKQMTQKDEVWYFRNDPYTGRYIDYFLSGAIMDEGELLNGKLHGQLVVYYKSGVIKSVADYKNGLLNGISKEYFKNGALMSENGLTNGRNNGFSNSYYINGQMERTLKPKVATKYDTLVLYNDKGIVIDTTYLLKNEPVNAHHNNDIAYYQTFLHESLRKDDMKTALKYINKLKHLDSAGTQTHTFEGLIYEREFRFDDAIAEFDYVLARTPYEWSMLEQRALARIKKYKYTGAKTYSVNRLQEPVTLKDLQMVPKEEQEEICRDVSLAYDLERTDFRLQQLIPEEIIKFCKEPLHK